MSLRGVNSYAITARRDAPDHNVSPDDFQLSLVTSMARVRLPEMAVPYCVDMRRERVLFTDHDAAGFARVRGAAFMFGEQLATAVGVHSVPFERLPELAAGLDPPPLLVFSPGRTGSTLLVRVLSAAGLCCASEPDILTQIARFAEEDFRLLPPPTRQWVARAAIAGLQRALGARLCIKLRSQSNERPLLLVRAAPGCRVVFMARGMRGWAMSRHRSFGETPEMVAAVLRQALDAFDKLLTMGSVAVLWFETLASDPERAVRICAPDAVFDPGAVHGALAEDSQAGTMVSREAVAGSAMQSDFFAVFRQAWPSFRRGALWHAETEALLSEMWSVGER